MFSGLRSTYEMRGGVSCLKPRFFSFDSMPLAALPLSLDWIWVLNAAAGFPVNSLLGRLFRNCMMSFVALNAMVGAPTTTAS